MCVQPSDHRSECCRMTICPACWEKSTLLCGFRCPFCLKSPFKTPNEGVKLLKRYVKTHPNWHIWKQGTLAEAIKEL